MRLLAAKLGQLRPWASLAFFGLAACARPPQASPPSYGQPGQYRYPAPAAPQPVEGRRQPLGPQQAHGRAGGQPPAATPRLAYQQGRASYYSDALQGRKTASGERYDPRLLTAAHRTLPFGTWVDVVRADGRSVRVRINDRGPFVSGRVIDLSRRAAQSLAMIRAGVVPVSLYLVRSP